MDDVRGFLERLLPTGASEWSVLVKVVHHPITLVLSRLPIAAFVALVAAKASEDPRSRVHFSDLLDGISRNTTMLFVGAVLLLIGWIIFQMNCPREVRRHPDVEDYVIEHIQIGHRRHYSQLIKAALSVCLSDLDLSSNKTTWNQYASRILRTSSDANSVKINVATHPGLAFDERQMFEAFWYLQNGSRLLQLCCAWFFLVTGSLFATWPTLITLLRVLRWLTSTPIGT